MTKLLENIHRAVNIGLVNELKIVCDRMGIDIHEVIRAAATKPFGFTPYYPGPGLGGHCIGVDPYYLTHKAIAIGYHPEVILAGRRINDRMGAHVAETVVKLMQPGPDLGPGLQGKLPGSTQHPGGGHHRRPA